MVLFSSPIVVVGSMTVMGVANPSVSSDAGWCYLHPYLTLLVILAVLETVKWVFYYLRGRTDGR